MQAIHQFTMDIYMLHILTLGELMYDLFFQWFCLETEGKTCKKNYVTLSEAALKSAIAIPWELPEILLLSKIPWFDW